VACARSVGWHAAGDELGFQAVEDGLEAELEAVVGCRPIRKILLALPERPEPHAAIVEVFACRRKLELTFDTARVLPAR
jgi:hypothetical protein